MIRPDHGTIYTIGHGRRTWDEFLAILDEHRIDLIVDVRWKPASRWTPWANRKRLEATLGDRYMFDGGRLGNPAHFGDPPIPEAVYGAALDDLERRVGASERVVIMCSESDPHLCHRETIGAAVADGVLRICHL